MSKIRHHSYRLIISLAVAVPIVKTIWDWLKQFWKG